ncbi:TPA: hypothetical protein QDA90_000841 [Burkholderia vietnamiensis]|uniref:hypothetical protein n=1 Tax=Burkholderia vietnamiensis TaxID=60552 RepID=UPI0007553C78|nr:hypothetical protein [Burkholderia vietnamiensis]KVE16634.1 hypothetical protein WI92_07185 [Burkholderia vietnamiensis]MDN8069041.1 hypothetical protein [Burkholderia vietnamiensis]HDR8921571.1 hypothetical protein [Burkholderia vietnamiensis]HDR8977965.1 hypothetical protein [Burkholderia vietnamiensis]HDR9065582.1 hypothetical protein [Burkholderia vietnamiensis]
MAAADISSIDVRHAATAGQLRNRPRHETPVRRAIVAARSSPRKGVFAPMKRTCVRRRIDTARNRM